VAFADNAIAEVVAIRLPKPCRGLLIVQIEFDIKELR
jgi:hypothetical protein